MKKTMLLVTLTSLFAATCATELNLQLNINDQAEPLRNRPTNGTISHPMPQPRPDHEQHLVTPAFQNPIHPEDAASDGGSPATYYTIKSSGRYYLTNDFRIIATASGASLIKVNAHNVTLNLNSKVITPHATATQTNLVGILINSKNNVQIMNGTIQCVPAYGTARITTGLNLGSSASYTIKVQDVFVNQATTTGITGSSLNDLSLERVAVNNMSGGAAITGISLSTCKNVNMTDCEINRNTTSVGNCKGLVLSACQDGTINNITASGNTTTATGDGILAMGISLASSCKNLVFTNCSATDTASSAVQTTATTYHTTGFNISASPLNKFVNCIANGNGGSAGVDNNCAGFYVYGASDNCSFINCEASRNRATRTSATTPVALGFRLDSNSGTPINNMLMDGCIANYNQTSGASSSDVVGIGIYGVNNSRFVRCTANKNTAAVTNASGFAMGQASSAGHVNNTFIDCLAIGNTSAGANVIVDGFYSSTGTNNRFIRCKANGQALTGTPSVATDGNGGSGIQLVSETRTQLIECETVGNNTTSNSTGLAYGVYLSSCTNCTVKDCYSAYNTAGTLGDVFGIYDTTSPTSTLFLSNHSIGHGKCLTGTELDASMQWNSNTRPTTGQNYFFKHAGTGDNPQNMIHEVPKWNLVSLSTSVKLWENVSIY